jgi:transglutaminase-like putative cysteine protease/predicted Zn-dependent protease
MTIRLSVALAVTLAAASARAAAPWEGEPFAADPAALFAAADRLAPPKDASVDVLLEEGLWRFDERGAATYTYRLVFRPVLPEAARRWSRIERGWAPWHQERPKVRARVVSAGGEVHELDPATLAEQGVGDDGELFSDRRILAGPMPGVSAGSVVEEVTTVRDVAPLFDGGVAHRFWMGQAYPVRFSRLRIEVPAALPLRYLVRGAKLSPREKVAGGVRTLVFERHDVPASPSIDLGAPRDVTPAPVVIFGWGRSWADAAERYGALWQRALAGAKLAATARAAAGAGASRDEAIRRIVGWVQKNVRYTGLELGDAAIVPAAPGETLKRRYGDCKDMSLLVVGLLREVGIDARLALLRTGWQEIAPELPGLGQFDHAIVRVEGKEPIWIDPTDPFVAPGRLPPADQGRLTLVTGPGQTALVRTPEATADDNTARTLREITLAELGDGRIAETRTFTGTLAAAERSMRARVPRERRDELDESYAREVFRAETFLGAEVQGEDDLAAPLRIRVEADRSDVLETDDDDAEVPVTPDPIFDALPQFLLGEGEEGAAAAKEPPPRTADLVLAVPYRWEIAYRVIPPDGFRARPVPAGATERFGPAVYEQRYALEQDGSVTATFRFDTGARRIPAADATALSRRVREIVRGKSPRVTFERTAAALLASGRVAEGLAEIRRLAKAHPREAMHPLHLAIALLQLGFGEDAAAEARRAIALEPDRAWAHRVLGYVLEHDAVGRFHGPGFDRAGALAEYEVAKEKDHSHAGGRAALAELWAHDPSGQRYGPGADLRRAIAEFRAVRTDLGSKDFDAGLLSALFAAGKHADAAALAREMPPGEERNATLVASVAVAEGIPAAERAAAALGDGARAALRAASPMLLRQRRYAPASALATAAARGAPNAAELFAQAETLAALRQWETLRDQGDEADRIVKRLFIAVLVSKDATKEIASLVSARSLEGAAREALDSGLPLPVAAARSTLRESGIPPDVLLDLILSKLEMLRDGEPAKGLRIRIRFPFAAAERGSTVYLVKEGRALRLLATDAAWPLLGAEAERLAAQGDAAGARRWLEWAREAVPGTEGDTYSPAGVLAALARPGAALDAPAARRAGAALAAFADAKGVTIPVLVAARSAAPDPGVRRAVAFALAQAYRGRNEAAPLLGVADAVLADDPASRMAFAMKAWALLRLRRPAELKPAADAILARLPDDPDVLGVLGSTALLMGDVDGAARAYRRLIAAGKAPPGVYNNAAWLELFREPIGKDALDWARRAVDQGQERDYASLNTLAAAYATLGKPAEAREIFLRSIDGGRTLRGADWFVFGRIAEAWGLDGTARAAYARVEPENGEGGEDPTSPYHLARRRLEKLGRPAGATPAAPSRPDAKKDAAKKDRAPKKKTAR